MEIYFQNLLLVLTETNYINASLSCEYRMDIARTVRGPGWCFEISEFLCYIVVNKLLFLDADFRSQTFEMSSFFPRYSHK
jgi:hypothetical protein